MKNSSAGIIIALLILIAVGVYATRSPQDSSQVDVTESRNTPANNTPASNEPAAANSSANSPATETAPARTVNYSDSGFAPEEVTVEAGETVTFTNTSNQTLQLASDPHPSHTDNPELNAGAIEPGESRTVTLTKRGTWGYHNHLDASDTGTVEVE